MRALELSQPAAAAAAAGHAQHRMQEAYMETVRA
jgi:hypothetical protein